MEILRTGTVYSDQVSLFGYAAWPSVEICGGDILVAASGMRTAHLDPFGKVILMRSSDGGHTFGAPSVIVDSPLDDRDAGILDAGNGRILVSTFNNTRQEQERWARLRKTSGPEAKLRALIEGQLSRITDEDNEKYHCSSLHVSADGAASFDRHFRIPVTAPHGPFKTPGGRIFYIGSDFSNGKETPEYVPEGSSIWVYELTEPDLEPVYAGAVPPFGDKDVIMCEPHAAALDEEHFLAQIRAQNESGLFTILQSESFDAGKTWTEPVMTGADGSPPHLRVLPDGRIVSVYGKRTKPYGISAMILENGKAAGKELPLVRGMSSPDLGYPASVVLRDESIFTVFYGSFREGETCGIHYVNWRP